MKKLLFVLRIVATIVMVLAIPYLYWMVVFTNFSAISIEEGFLGVYGYAGLLLFIYALVVFLLWTCDKPKALKTGSALLLAALVLVSVNYAVGRSKTGLPLNYDRDTAENMPHPDWGIDPELYLPYTSQNIAYLPEASSLHFAVDDELPRMDAAVALLPMMSSFATACYPPEATTVEWDWSNPNWDFEYNEYGFSDAVLQFNNSDMGFDALATGSTDVFFGLEAADYQLETAAQYGVEFEYTPIALEAFVFLVNEQNPVSSLTLEQIRGIYTGEIRNWSEVGGTPGAIVAYQRNQGSGSQTTMERFMEGYTMASAPSDLYISSMGGLVKLVADYDNAQSAIGYSFRYYASELIGSYPVKLLEIDGVPPTTEYIADGSYPITENFYAVTRKGDLEAGRAQLAQDPNASSREANLARLIDWICSEQGQYLVRESGYAPAW